MCLPFTLPLQDAMHHICSLVPSEVRLYLCIYMYTQYSKWIMCVCTGRLCTHTYVHAALIHNIRHMYCMWYAVEDGNDKLLLAYFTYLLSLSKWLHKFRLQLSLAVAFVCCCCCLGLSVMLHTYKFTYAVVCFLTVWVEPTHVHIAFPA